MKKAVKKNSPTKKIILWVFLALLGIFLISISLLPTWISSPYGREKTLSWINDHIKGKIETKNLKLSWLGGQKVENFELKDEKGKSLISINSFSTEASLWQLLWGAATHHYYLGNTVLLNPTFSLVESPDGVLNVEKALQNRKNKSPKKRVKKSSFNLPIIHGDLLVSKGEVYYSAEKMEPITLKDISLKINDKEDLVSLSFLTKQGNHEGSIVANGKFHENISLQVNVYQFPLAILDQFTHSSIFSEGIGKTVNLDLKIEKNPQSLVFHSTIQSPNVRGSFDGKSQNGRFYLNPGGKMIWTITPGLFKEIIDTHAESEWNLANKTEMHLTVQQLEFPFQALKNRSWKDVLFQGTLGLERAEIFHPEFGHFSLNRLYSEWKTKDKLSLVYHGQLNSDGGTTQMEGEMTVHSSGKIDFGLVSKNFPVPLLELFTDDSVYLTRILGHSLEVMTLGTYENKQLQASVNLASSTLSLQGTVEGPLDRLWINLGGEFYYSSRYGAYFGPFPSINIQAEAGIQKGILASAT